VARTFFPLRISDIRRETDDTVSLAFDVPAELAATFAHAPGQFLTFRLEDVAGQLIDRSYSICSGPEDGELRVAVKRLVGGVFGERAHTSMAVGDTLAVLPPLGRFTTPIDASHAKAYLMIGAGSGIAPIMALVRAVLSAEPNSRITLIYGNRGSGSIIFRDALADLKDRFMSRLDVIHIFSREAQDAEVLNGRITAEKLRELGKHLVDVPSYDDAFVCGPQPMTLDLRQALIDLGVRVDRIHLELYGSHVAQPARATDPAAADTVTIDVTVGGIRRRIDGQYDETVLDAATAAGLDVPFSCTGGVCATCRARVVDGTVEMAVNYSLQQWELEAGFVLTCQSRPTTPSVTIDYDAA
jgi:ring-1,2-phenylacetyl-CoA epoxidase subunit PaaE